MKSWEVIQMYSKLSDGSFMVAGFVARDAEIKTTQSGKTLTTWGVAAAKTQTADGKWETKWTNCQAWHDTARAAANIRKGDTVLCVGSLETNEYNGKTYKNLVVEFFCKMPTGMEAAVPAVSSNPGVSAENDLSEFEEILGDGDLPF